MTELKETIIFYGPFTSLHYYARKNKLDPREIVLATRPDRLEGRRFKDNRVKKVMNPGWRVSKRDSPLVLETEMILSRYNIEAEIEVLS
jgi:hypothetical protein